MTTSDPVNRSAPWGVAVATAREWLRQEPAVATERANDVGIMTQLIIQSMFFDRQRSLVVAPFNYSEVGPGVPCGVVHRLGRSVPVLAYKLDRAGVLNSTEPMKREMERDLEKCLRNQMQSFGGSKMFGLASIGLYWMACQLDRGGELIVLHAWQEEITDYESCVILKEFAEAVYALESTLIYR